MVRHDPASAAVVRREIEFDLLAAGVEEGCVADIVLIASELITNAVVHAEPAGHLDVSWDISWSARAEGGTVTLWVRDSSADRPQPRAAEQDAANGRGLAIVAAIAAEWGVDSLPRGKQVWARVPVTRAG